MLADEEGHYESEEEHAEAKPREKPVGPPLELEIPLRPPPALPEKVLLSLFSYLEEQLGAKFVFKLLFRVLTRNDRINTCPLLFIYIPD